MHDAAQDAIESGTADAAVTAAAGSRMHGKPSILIVGVIEIALLLGAVLWLKRHGRRKQAPE